MLADYCITFMILFFLAFLLILKARYHPEGNGTFFDIRNAGAMRGFWCAVVMFTHTPEAYRNGIQDMVGSFGYIGVTFFFMTSAYGLSLGLQKKKNSLDTFWQTRLPKLLVPNWIVNFVFALLFLALFRQIPSLSSLLSVNNWVLWLLGCYLIFWICHRFFSGRYTGLLVCTAVFMVSVSLYVLRYMVFDLPGGWCAESVGFIWGILLAENHDKCREFFTRNWFFKVLAGCLLSMVLGVLYLKFKPVVFWGAYLLRILLGVSILGFILILNSRIQIGNPLIRFLGEISFEIYLTHATVFSLIAFVFPTLRSGMFLLTAFPLTILLSAGLHGISRCVLNKIHF